MSFKYSPDGEAIDAASSRFGYTGQVSLAQFPDPPDVNDAVSGTLDRGWQDSAYPALRAVGASAAGGAVAGAIGGGLAGGTTGAVAGGTKGGLVGAALGAVYFGSYAVTWNKTFDRCMKQQ